MQRKKALIEFGERFKADNSCELTLLPEKLIAIKLP